MMLTPSHSELKAWSKLKMAKYRCQEQTFLAEGVKVVRELLRSSWETRAIMVMKGREDKWESIPENLPGRIPVYQLTEAQWKGVTQDKEPEGVMAHVVIPERQDEIDVRKLGRGHLLMGYRISNPNNLGALLRTAHWFGIQTVILSDHSVDVTHPKVVRSSMGSLFHLHILEEADFHKIIPEMAPLFYVIGTDAALGVAPHAVSSPAALILGNETHGLPEALKASVQENWCIPGAGGMESLSLPQASAIMIYELTKEKVQR